MKAGVKLGEGPGHFEIKEIDTPGLGEKDVLIRIKVSGVCGVDVLIYDWAIGKTFPARLPLVLGHECSGMIEDVGRDVKGLNRGDRVTVESMIGCGNCYYCRQGMTNLCNLHWEHVGITFNGSFAEYLKAPMAIVHRLPENVSFESGAFAEPLSIVVNLFDRIKFGLGNTVVIIGPGTLGLLAIQAARSYGASKIIVIGLEKDKERMLKAKELGADVTLVSDRENPLDRVLELTHGMGSDVVVESGGTPESFNQAIKMAAGASQVAILGYSNYGELEPIRVARQEISVFGVRAYRRRHFMQALLWLGSGKVLPETIISHRLDLDHAEKGIHLMRDREASKVCLIP
jgi:L-iditol 2-dehydrogenase